MTPEELQAQLDKFNKELDKTNQRLEDSGDILDESVIKRLAKAVAEARNLNCFTSVMLYLLINKWPSFLGFTPFASSW